ncbi:MAG: DUF5683 domain-containing protein [Gracilimonas sp.]|nr:DUF5683 domain-containing protein [Gracilimonas sp.]
MNKYVGTLLLTLLTFSLPFSQIIAQNNLGSLKFEFNTDSAYVVLGNELFSAVKIASGDSLKLRTGVRLISLQTHFDKSETLFIKVHKDSTTTYSYTFKKNNYSPATLTNNIAARKYYNTNVMVLSDQDSDIFYNGEYQGTGFAKFNTFGKIGELELRNPEFGHKKRRLNAPEQKISFIESHLRPNKSTAIFYSILPGASQLYKKQHLKALIFGASAVTMFTFAGVKSSNYHKELDVFYEFQEQYNNATTEQEALRLGNLTESQQNKVQRLDNQRRGLLIAGILIYGYNIYDAFTSKPTGGYMNKDKDLRFYLSTKEITGNLGAAGTFRYDF